MLEKLFDGAEHSEAEKMRERIKKSSDYKKLSVYPPLKSVFEEYYDSSVLEADDIDALSAKQEALHYVLPAAKKLQKTVLGGNAWDLEIDDKPDFSSAESLKVFMDKMVCSEDIDEDLYNITNISENELMKIFEESTIKDARDLFYYVDVNDLTKSNDEILQSLDQAGYWYCIEPSSIYEAKKNIDGEIESLEILNFMAKRSTAWLKLAKLGFAGLAISATFLATRMGIIPDSMDLAMLGASLGASALYFLVG